MRKKIRQALVSLVILFILIIVIQKSIDYTYRQRVINKFTRLLRHQVDAEVMIFGSSAVYHQFNPIIIRGTTGCSAYNMGWPGTSFTQYNGLITEYLSYEKKCSHLVISCDFNALGKNELVTNPDLFLPFLNNDNIYKSLCKIEPRKMMLAKYLPGYKLTLFNKSFYKEMFLTTPYNDSLYGYFPLKKKFEGKDAPEPFDAHYDDFVYNELIATIKEIRGKGIKVVLVIPPILESGYHIIKNIEFIKNKYKALAGPGIFLLDYTSNPICKSSDYFYNFTHLNLAGATLFSNTFATDLSKIIHE